MTLSRSNSRRSNRSRKVRSAARPINPRAYGRELAISVARPLAELFIRQGRPKPLRKIDWKSHAEEIFLGFRLVCGPVRPLERPREPLACPWAQGDQDRAQVVPQLGLKG